MKIAFVDFWYNYESGLKTLSFFKYFTSNPKFEIVEADQNPDLIICSVFSSSHTNYNNIPKLLWSGENISLWLNFGKATSFEGVKWALLTNYRQLTSCPSSIYYKYIPFACVHYDMNQIREWRNKYLNKPKTKFCCFVSGNTNDNREGYLLRENFFQALNMYKQVDSAGAVLNNVGYLAPRGEDYIEWVSDYKFMICFENSQGLGYLTEKVFTPYAAGTIPIYWADSTCYKLFNTKATILFTDLSETLSKIIQIDNNQELYENIRKEDIFLPESRVLERNNLIETLDDIIKQVENKN